MQKDIRDISVARWFDPLMAVFVISATYFFFHESSLSNTHLVLVIVFFTTAYYFISELLRAPWSMPRTPHHSYGEVLQRTLTKFLGVVCGIALTYVAFRIFPEYSDPEAIRLVHSSFFPFLIFVLPASFIFIFLAEYILGKKTDGTYQLGLLLQGRFKEIDWNEFLNGILEWTIRCIFVLINFFAAAFLITRLRTNGMPDPGEGFVRFIVDLDTVLFTLIIFAILPGYIFASRLIRTEIKRVDRSWFGWAITLSCYSPLSTAVFTAWVSYAPTTAIYPNGVWATLASDYPLILYSLGFCIMFWALIHLWGESMMGIRSSVLASRGVITTGPFAFTKHPVYVSKCAQWAVLYLPVLNAVGLLDSIRSGVLFFFVCVVYAARALAEEKLLAEDKDYVRYATYMDKKSVFAFMGRLLPWMSFKWRYEFWKKYGYIHE